MKSFLILTAFLLGTGSLSAGTPELAKERSEDILITEISSWLDTDDFLKVDTKQKLEYFHEIYSGKLKNSVTHIGEFELTPTYSVESITKAKATTQFINITVLRPQIRGLSWRGWVDIKLNLATNEISYEIPKNYADAAHYVEALSKRKETLDVADIKKHAETDCQHKSYKKYTLYSYDIELFRSHIIGSVASISNLVEFRINYERPLQHGNKYCSVAGLRAEDIDQIFLK